MKYESKILICLLVFCMVLGAFASCASEKDTDTLENTSDPAAEKESVESTSPVKQSKTIDIYLIAGQSNAAGSTYISDRSSAYAFASELEKGFSNILFSGQASDSDRYYWRKTTLGLGRGKDGSYMGPEAGMAKALSAYYNPETGNTAGFIKVAYGGTSLLNVTDGQNALYKGNWVPPSYASDKGLYYGDSAITGGLYRNLLAIFKQQLQMLSYNGFESFNIKGLYWMQGENDRDNPQEYKKAFQFLVQDLRRDLSNIVREMTDGDDRGASEMPIFVGTISKTFDSATQYSVETNSNFINMQKLLPNLPNVGDIIIVDNSDYAINKMEGPNSVAIGSDQYHWNQSDHLAIGDNVGKAILAYYHYNNGR